MGVEISSKVNDKITWKAENGTIMDCHSNGSWETIFMES